MNATKKRIRPSLRKVIYLYIALAKEVITHFGKEAPLDIALYISGLGKFLEELRSALDVKLRVVL